MSKPLKQIQQPESLCSHLDISTYRLDAIVTASTRPVIEATIKVLEGIFLETMLRLRETVSHAKSGNLKAEFTFHAAPEA